VNPLECRLAASTAGAEHVDLGFDIAEKCNELREYPVDVCRSPLY
jgi:hypothetical protein